MEYLLFMTLLAIPADEFAICFRMFDLDGSGSLGKEEFLNVLRTLRANHPLLSKQRDVGAGKLEDSSIVRLFFAGGAEEITISQFKDFMESLHNGILQLEFQRFDPDNTGFISAKSFAMSVVGWAHPDKVDEYLKRIQSLEGRPDKISFEEFQSFNRGLEQLDDVTMTIRCYAATKDDGGFNKADFRRAYEAVTGLKISHRVVKIIFEVFDRNGDGHLDIDELLAVMSSKSSRSLSHHRDLGFYRRLKCIISCCKGDGL